jgi:type I restriction enzyme R subunit
MKNALKDPISGEVWKTIFFCVSRHHASKITQLLNELAHEMYPWKYNSDFALQVTSDIPLSQQFTINFSNGNLNGYTKFLDWYKSSKTRVCVTVGMMTTGYDCEDILNLCLARPIFSPSDFVQMKGRWTRTFSFDYGTKREKKSAFKLFDFFENCKYFEEDYPYDKVLDLPKIWEEKETFEGDEPEFTEKTKAWIYESDEKDYITIYEENTVGTEWMKIDRELYIWGFEKTLKEHAQNDEEFKQAVENKDYEYMENHIKSNIFDRPTEYYNLGRLREWYKTDRKIWLWEIIDFIFFGKQFKTKNDIANEEFEKYVIEKGVDTDKYYYAKEFFKYYLVDEEFRGLVNKKQYREYAWNPEITELFRVLGKDKLEQIPDYIHDNVVLNKFY